MNTLELTDDEYAEVLATLGRVLEGADYHTYDRLWREAPGIVRIKANELRYRLEFSSGNAVRRYLALQTP